MIVVICSANQGLICCFRIEEKKVSMNYFKEIQIGFINICFRTVSKKGGNKFPCSLEIVVVSGRILVRYWSDSGRILGGWCGAGWLGKGT